MQSPWIKDLSGKANFPENDVQKAVGTVRILFDPNRNVSLNEKIAPKIEEIRSLIRDGYIPNVRAILCNNGDKWTSQADNWVADAEEDYGDKVKFIHFNDEKRFHNLIGGCVFSFLLLLVLLRPKESRLCRAIRLN